MGSFWPGPDATVGARTHAPANHPGILRMSTPTPSKPKGIP